MSRITVRLNQYPQEALQKWWHRCGYDTRSHYINIKNSATCFNCTHNIPNSADKSRKTYVIQLGTQSSIGRKKKKNLLCNNRHKLHYRVINNSERGLSYTEKKILANRSLRLKIRPTSDDANYNHKQNNLTQWLKLGGSSQLHGEKGVEGTTFHNANTQKGI